MNLLRAGSRVTAIMCVITLATLSWTFKEIEVRAGPPGQPHQVFAYFDTPWIPRTGLSGQLEHLFGYLCAALAVKLGWPMLRTRTVIAALAVMAAILEIGQIWVPGRTSQFIDFAASGFGAAIGAVVGRLSLHRLLRGQR